MPSPLRRNSSSRHRAERGPKARRRRRALAGAAGGCVLAVCLIGTLPSFGGGRTAGQVGVPASGGVVASASPSGPDATFSSSAAPSLVPASPPSASAPSTGTIASPSATRSTSAPATRAATASTPPASAAPPAPPASSDAVTEVLRLVNVERAKAGCGALALNDRLAGAAQNYSDTMARTNTFSHTGADGSTMTSRITAAGYTYSSAGENIARGQKDAAAVMDSWMNSPGHRANILNCGFTEIGIGLHRDGFWWTQDFGHPR